MNKWIVICNKNCMKRKLDFSLFHAFIKSSLDDVTIFYDRDYRFENDQIFRFTENELIILDGVVLNLSELKEQLHTQNIDETFDQIKKEQMFFSKLRGPFCGMYYHSKQLYLYGNHTGDAPVFYYFENGLFLASNDENLISDFLRENSITYSFNKKAAMYSLTYGYMIDESTFISEIYRLAPGRYIHLSDGGITNAEYHHFCFEDREMSFDDAIETVDSFFRKAVKRCFDKDLEYNFKYHLADMSGGLDSRMVNWVAKDMGYSDIYNINYCQSKSDELDCSSKASAYLGFPFIHMQLDDASFLYDIDEIIEMNYGLAFYSGITGGKRLLNFCNPGLFGLEHTGQLGDVVIGSFSGAERHNPPDSQIRRFSKLIDFEAEEDVMSNYRNSEEFAFYNRGFRGVLSTHLTRRHFFYSVSPFLDVDFLQACQYIPMAYRQHHKLYWAWIDKKYPEAASIPSTRERSFLKTRAKSWKKTIIGKMKHVGTILHISKFNSLSNDMNPYDYWYESNQDLRAFLNQYYNNNVKYVNCYEDVAACIDRMFASDNARDKMLALTVVAAMKRYFGTEGNDVN